MKKPPFTLDRLLNDSCWNPENFEESEEWQTNVGRKWDGEGEYPNYPGIRRYSITLHCTEYTLTAKRRDNGTFEILDYTTQSH